MVSMQTIIFLTETPIFQYFNEVIFLWILADQNQNSNVLFLNYSNLGISENTK